MAVLTAGANTLNITMTLITGTLSGTVTDQNGKALSGVTVAISGGGMSASTLTASNGTYQITQIPPGTYTIIFTLSGYTTITD